MLRQAEITLLAAIRLVCDSPIPTSNPARNHLRAHVQTSGRATLPQELQRVAHHLRVLAE